MVIQSDRTIAQVARELDINAGTLSNWVQKYRQENPEPEKKLIPADYGRLAQLEEDNRRLRMEKEFLKSRGLLRQGAGLDEKSALIEAEKNNYPIAWMCKQLQVPRSSFYAWRTRVGTVTATQARREALRELIIAEFNRQRRTAGCRRITAALNEAGTACSVGLVADLMRELGLAAIQPRAWRRTTVPAQAARTHPDLLGGDFDPASAEPGQHLVGDITYLRTGQGWVYLAVVLDLATQMVIGWQMAPHMRTSLVIDALAMACTHGYAAKNAVFHTRPRIAIYK